MVRGLTGLVSSLLPFSRQVVLTSGFALDSSSPRSPFFSVNYRVPLFHSLFRLISDKLPWPLSGVEWSSLGVPPFFLAFSLLVPARGEIRGPLYVTARAAMGDRPVLSSVVVTFFTPDRPPE